MCASCLSHLLADARLKDESATCPNCRCEISKTACIRNLAVEKAISELPAECRFCSARLPRSELAMHEGELCQERCVSCRVAYTFHRSSLSMSPLLCCVMYVCFILMMTPDCVCAVTRCGGDDVPLVGVGRDGGNDDDAVSWRSCRW